MSDKEPIMDHRRPPTDRQLREHNEALWQRETLRRRRQREREEASRNDDAADEEIRRYEQEEDNA